MRTAALALLLMIGAGTPAAFAAPDAGAATGRTKDELRRYRAAMAEAKKLAKKGNHAAAIAAYDKVLALRPGDLTALTDQGWSAFLMKDLARAEAITRKAVAAPIDARITAAAYYNLGRILEERKDRAGAVECYQRSLRLRANRVVRERLTALDPAAGSGWDPLKPEPMAGPYAGVDDFCKTLDKSLYEYCPSDSEGQVLKNVGGPFDSVAWIKAGGTSFECFVAVHLPRKGWYVESRGTACQEGEFLERVHLSFEAADLVPGGGREAVLRAQDQYSERDAVDPDDPGLGSTMLVKRCESSLTACGVGKSGVPSCLRLRDGEAEFCRDDGSAPWQWQLQAVFGADGQVEVKGTGKLDAEARSFLGRRPLAFP